MNSIRLVPFQTGFVSVFAFRLSVTLVVATPEIYDYHIVAATTAACTATVDGKFENIISQVFTPTSRKTNDTQVELHYRT